MANKNDHTAPGHVTPQAMARHHKGSPQSIECTTWWLYVGSSGRGGGKGARGGGECDSGGEKWQLHENKGRRTRKPTHSATPRDRHTTRKGTTPAPYRLLQAGEGALCVVMGCPDHERWGPTWGADLGVAARAPRSPSMSFSRAVRIGTLGTAVPCFPPKTPPKIPPPSHFGGITRQKPACGNFQHRDVAASVPLA